MERARTRGQPAARAAIAAMVAGWAPHAVLLTGPPGSGKTTLALDLAAGLLCRAADPDERPCRECRSCRMVEHGNHPDLHRLAPAGPGNQIVIGGGDARTRGIRDLVSELALLPVEGGARLAVIEAADRMNEDAQSALLKTLEEPPAGVTIVLCADEEERLLPTVRSRCVRVRLAPVGTRDVEAILAEHGIADASLAGRVARLSGGRPGLALVLARAPEALMLRGELARGLLDLASARPAARLATIRDLLARAGALVAALDAASAPEEDDPQPRRRGRGSPRTPPPASAASEQPGEAEPSASAASSISTPPGDLDEEPGRKVAPAERRRAAATLIGVWADLSRDIALAAAGMPGAARDLGLLDETAAAAGTLGLDDIAAFIERLARAGERLEANVLPELLLDALALAWPAPRAAA